MEEQINEMISMNSVLIIGNSNDLETQLSTDIIKNTGASYYLHDISAESDKEAWTAAIENTMGTTKLPLIFIGGELIGGYFELKEADKGDELIPRLCAIGVPNNAMPEGDADLMIDEPEYRDDEDQEDLGGLFE